MDSSKHFRELVEQKGRNLRDLTYETLVGLADAPAEEVVVSGRRGTISVVVEPFSAGSVRVVVQGFLDGRLVRSVKSVGLDGFYKNRDGSVTDMEAKEFYDYD